MAFCSECGAKLVEGAGFCSECGTRVIQPNTGTVAAAQPAPMQTTAQPVPMQMHSQAEAQQQAAAQIQQRAKQPVQAVETVKEAAKEVTEWITNMVQASDAPGEVVLSAWSNGRTVDPSAIVAMLAQKATAQVKATAQPKPQAQPKQATQPKPSAQPKPAVQSQPAATAQPQPQPTAQPQPQPTAQPQPQAAAKKFCRKCGKPVINAFVMSVAAIETVSVQAEYGPPEKLISGRLIVAVALYEYAGCARCACPRGDLAGVIFDVSKVDQHVRTFPFDGCLEISGHPV